VNPKFNGGPAHESGWEKAGRITASFVVLVVFIVVMALLVKLFVFACDLLDCTAV
jgi:hypothetical protein